MQSLDVISVNLWQILVSVCNLLLLLWIVKKFLYRPVKEVLAKRQGSIDSLYQEAKDAKKQAEDCQKNYEEKLSHAEDEAQELLKRSVESAQARQSEILAQAKEKAEGILRQSQSQAELEISKARAEIRKEIADVSTKLAEKMLEREISAEDHKNLIDSYIKNLGDKDGGN